MIFVIFIIALAAGSLAGYYFYSNYWSDSADGIDDGTEQYESLEGNTNNGGNGDGNNQQNGGDEIEWHSYYDGLKLSENSNKPVMIDFYYDDCPACVMLDEDTYVDERVILKSNSFVCVKVDLYETEDYNGQGIVEEYQVTGFPTIVYLNSQQNEVHRRVGYQPPGPFLEDMDFALTL
jgi:thiol-disulfide isomerase/thioredoxin